VRVISEEQKGMKNKKKHVRTTKAEKGKLRTKPNDKQ